MVLLSHVDKLFFARLWSLEAPVPVIAELGGRIAVIIFLLLSGHLITQSIRSNIEKHGRFAVTDYTVARVARIYPPLIGAILLCAAIGAVITVFNLPGGQIPYGLPGDLYRERAHYQLSASEILTSLFMLRGLNDCDAPLWTLYFEVHAYVAAIGVAIWFGKQWQFRPFPLFMAILGFGLALLQPTLSAIWIIGALTNLFPLDRWEALIAGLALTGLITAVAVLQPAWILAINSTAGFNFQIIIGAALACFLILALPKLHYARWLVATGGFSYSLYVVHYPLLLLAMSLSQDWIGHGLVRTALVACASGATILVIAIGFAAVFERQAEYRRFLSKTVTLICHRLMAGLVQS